jgi:hypothetical protein
MRLSSHQAEALGPRDRHLTSARHGVSLEAPAGWTLSQHSGYGDTVAVLLHPDGGRISVTASPTTATDPRALFEQNRKGLVAQNLLPAPPQPGPHGFLSVDITAPGRPDRLRQLYFVRPTPQGRQAVILTLVCRDNLFAELTSALAFVVDRLELDDPVLSNASGDNLPSTKTTTSSGSGGATSPSPGRAAAAGASDTSGAIKPDASGVGGGSGTTAATTVPPGETDTGAGGSGGQLRPGHRKRKSNAQNIQQL